MFLEAGRRLAGFLDDAQAALGDREAVIGRELTKVHEELLRGRLSVLRSAVRRRRARRGHGARDRRTGRSRRARRPSAMDDAIRRALAAGRSVRELSEEVARSLGRSRREVYRRALELRGG